MKFIIFIIIIQVLFSCSKKNTDISFDVNNNKSETKVDEQSIPEYVSANLWTNKVMYVNAQDGLRVRKNPDIDAEKIYLLKDNQEVQIREIEPTKIVIDDREGYWVLIETDEVQGYVFTGYLVEKAAASPEYLVVYDKDEIVESITLPDGKSILRSDIEQNESFYKIDKIRLYYAHTIESSYKIIRRSVVFFRIDNNDEWLYCITCDVTDFGFVRLQDISEKSFYGDLANNEGNYYRSLLPQEYSILKTNQNIKRYGPLLMITVDNKIIKFWDSLGGDWGIARYLLLDIYDNNDLLLHEQHYEGGKYFIYNTDSESPVVFLNQKPIFNENKTAFVSYGTSYIGPLTFELYSVHKNEYRKEREADVCTLLQIHEEKYYDYELEWKNDATVEIKYENIGTYTISYDDNEWQEKTDKVIYDEM